MLVSNLGKNHPVRPFNVRVRALRGFLRSRGWLERSRITKLRDPYGPAIRRKELEALVVSEETRSSGLDLNRIRRLRGLKALQVHVVRLVRAEDKKPISATRIRTGEIDPKGRQRR